MSGKRRSHFGRIFRRKGRNGKWLPGYFIRVRRGKTTLERRGGNTYAEACAYLAKLSDEVRRQDELGGGISPIAFEDFAEMYLDSVQATGAESTLRSVASKVRSALVPAFKGRLMDEIRRQDVGRYIAEREKQVSVATRNRDLAVLSSMFRKAIEMGHAEINPVVGIGRPAEAVLPVPYIDQEGQRRLVDACDDEIRPLVILALDTGMRVGELLRLEWRDVERAGRVITVRAPKNKQPRTIPFGDRAAATLQQLFDQRVIPLAAHTPDRVLSRISTAWTGVVYGRYRAAVRSAGLPHLRFHDLRHIYAVDLVRAGVPLPDVAKLLGHKTLTMTMRYASHAPKDATFRARDLLEAARRGDTPDAVRETA